MCLHVSAPAASRNHRIARFLPPPPVAAQVGGSFPLDSEAEACLLVPQGAEAP